MSIFKRILENRGLNPDAQMTVIEHIEVFRWHLIRSLIATLICGIAVYTQIETIFQKIILGPANPDFITYRWLCSLGHKLNIPGLCVDEININFQSTELASQFLMSISAAFFIGFIIAFPYVFWEFWRFLKPALKKKELKYAKGIVFWGGLLFFIGVLFAYYLVAPFTISFFANYQLAPEFKNIFTINNYYSTMNNLVLGLGVTFELPVLVYFLSRLGVITPKLLRKGRRYAYLIITVLAAMLTPEIISMMIACIPLVGLYEISILVCARIVKSKKKNEQLDW